MQPKVIKAIVQVKGKAKSTPQAKAQAKVQAKAKAEGINTRKDFDIKQG